MPSLRGLAWACVEVGAVSTAFPIIASLLPVEAVPGLLGVVDVAVAGVLVVLAFRLEAQARPHVTLKHRADAYRLIRRASVALIVLLVVFFLAPANVSWPVLLVGLGWRAWLAIWVLPSLLAAMDRNRAGRDGADAPSCRHGRGWRGGVPGIATRDRGGGRAPDRPRRAPGGDAGARAHDRHARGRALHGRRPGHR